MASKRILQSSINWQALTQRVPKEQKTNLLNFKAKTDGYLRALLAYPEKAPAIDWDAYRKTVPNPQMVDEFKQKYEALQIPYPPDNVTKSIDEQEQQVKVEIQQFKKESDERIASYQKQIDYLKGLIPFEQMTMEDFKDSYPELALDPINKPTFWPHDEAEQMDYRDKGHPMYGQDPHTAH